MASIVLTPYLAFHDCAAAIRFYAEVFGNVGQRLKTEPADG